MVVPRIEHKVFIEVREKETPYYRFHHAVESGVTSLAQEKYSYEIYF